MLPMHDMSRPEVLRQKDFNAVANDLVVVIAEQSENLAICKPDDPLPIDDEHGVGGCVERALSEVGRERYHRRCPQFDGYDVGDFSLVELDEWSPRSSYRGLKSNGHTGARST
jgi:hypothetical protein